MQKYPGYNYIFQGKSDSIFSLYIVNLSTIILFQQIKNILSWSFKHIHTTKNKLNIKYVQTTIKEVEASKILGWKGGGFGYKWQVLNSSRSRPWIWWERLNLIINWENNSWITTYISLRRVTFWLNLFQKMRTESSVNWFRKK